MQQRMGGIDIATYLLVAATVIITCVIFSKISAKIGIPTLLAFIVLGMFFGSDGVVKIPFDNYMFAEQICSVALVFIMFYGGFGTNWASARSVAAKAIVLSSFGTVITAGLVGLFCRFILKIAPLESFLIGAVISSTDAASVFSILRFKRLNLRYNTASLLEVESGSNDPFSYMLTLIVLALMNGNSSAAQFSQILIAQIAYGLIFGFGIAALALVFLKKFCISSSGYTAIFIVAIALISYAAPTALGGNGYLSVYITGVILGNSKIGNKPELVHFFDGVTGLMQMLLFFMLGLLAFPSQLPDIAMRALAIALFLTFVARPIAVFTLLSPFKSNVKQKILVSWAGMRGAASIAFSIMVVINPAIIDNDVFHIVFFIVLFSILLQGTLIPILSKKLDMTDDACNVMKTFNDYMDEIPIQFVRFRLDENHEWTEKKICEVTLPPNSLIVLLIREKASIIPDGETVFHAGDQIIMSGQSIKNMNSLRLYEKEIGKGDLWEGKLITDIFLQSSFILVIKRSDKIIIPTGNTMLLTGDILIMTDKNAIPLIKVENALTI